MAVHSRSIEKKKRAGVESSKKDQIFLEWNSQEIETAI